MFIRVFVLMNDGNNVFDNRFCLLVGMGLGFVAESLSLVIVRVLHVAGRWLLT